MNSIQLCGAAGVLLLIFVIGIASGRRVKSNHDFESGGGRAGYGTVSGMILGTAVGGSCTIGTAQLAFHYGLSAWWYTLGCGLACLAMGVLYVKPFRRTEATTLLGIIRREYGKQVAVTTSLLASFAALIGLVAQVISASAVVPFIIPGLSVTGSVAVSVILMLAYVVFGGALGAGEVGRVKTVLLYAAVLAGVLVVLRSSGLRVLWGELDHQVYFDLFARGVGEEGGKALSVMLGIAAGPTYIHAIQMARSDGVARRSEFVSALLIPPIGLGSALIGMFMRVYHPMLENPKNAFPEFVLMYTPDLVSGIIMGTLLLGIIGSGAGIAMAAGISINRDILQPLLRVPQDSGASLRVSRLCIAALLAAAGCLSTGILGDMIQVFSILAAGFRAAVMFVPLTCACLLPGRVPKEWMLAAVLAGPLASVLFSLWPVLPVDGMAMGVAVGVVCCGAGLLLRNREQYGTREKTTDK